MFVYNPHASNYQRSQKWIDTVAESLDIKPRRIDWLKRGTVFDHDIANLHAHPQKVILVAIAGGDGTVSAVANRLMYVLGKSKNSKNPKKPGDSKAATETAGRILILPLWGGNANDMACMLNGLNSAITTTQLLKDSKPVPVPLIKIELLKPGYVDKTIFACCYASFGASAYAARKLDQKNFAKKKSFQSFAPMVVAREVATVLKALGGAPAFHAKFGERETKVYEHTLVNGPRLAKINRIPVGLTEPEFFHAIVTKKNPSVLLDLLRLATGKHAPAYSKKSQNSFVLHDATDAQIDGEVHRLEEQTKVDAEIIWPPFLWISVNFANGKDGPVLVEP